MRIEIDIMNDIELRAVIARHINSKFPGQIVKNLGYELRGSSLEKPRMVIIADVERPDILDR